MISCSYEPYHRIDSLVVCNEHRLLSIVRLVVADVSDPCWVKQPDRESLLRWADGRLPTLEPPCLSWYGGFLFDNQDGAR